MLIAFMITVALEPAFAATRFAFEQLRAIVEVEGVRDLPGVIGRLPDEMKANYTLVYASRSLQGASYEYPRAVLFGSDARFVVTFNGHPTQRYYDRLELIQFREARREFEFRSITFGSQVQISEPNPPLCLSCHGQSPRPLWESYRYAPDSQGHWPGVYGSTHDAPALTPAERDAFQHFRQRAAGHERYRHLMLDHPGSGWYPYGAGPNEHRWRPNNRLGNLLARLNARKIARQIAAAPLMRTHPATVWSWLLGCPEAERDGFAARVRQLFSERFSAPWHADLHRELDTVDADNALSFMFEKLLSGLDVYTWNLSIETLPAGERFSTGIVSIDRLVAASLLEEQATAEPLLAPHYAPRSSDYVYEKFARGYYQRNVAPGGVGPSYDRLGAYYDEERARDACPGLERQTAHEPTPGVADAGPARLRARGG